MTVSSQSLTTWYRNVTDMSYCGMSELGNATETRTWERNWATIQFDSTFSVSRTRPWAIYRRKSHCRRGMPTSPKEGTVQGAFLFLCATHNKIQTKKPSTGFEPRTFGSLCHIRAHPVAEDDSVLFHLGPVARLSRLSPRAGGGFRLRRVWIEGTSSALTSRALQWRTAECEAFVMGTHRSHICYAHDRPI